MAYTQVPTRTATDTNSSADVNQLELNIEAVKGGTGSVAPTTSLEGVNTALTFSANKKILGRKTNSIGYVEQIDIGTNLQIDGSGNLSSYETEYLGGSTYNTVTITIAGTAAGTANVRSVFIPYQTNDGAWRLRFNVSVSCNSATLTGNTITVAGVLFKNVGSFQQACSSMYTVNAYSRGYCATNTNEIHIEHASGTVTNYWVSGDVELNAKPTWAN